MTCESAPSSPGSADSTTGSPPPASSMPSSARSMSGDEESSTPTGPESPSTQMSMTFVKAQKAHHPDDCERWEPSEVTNTLTERDGTAPTTLVTWSETDHEKWVEDQLPSLSAHDAKEPHTLVPFTQNQREEVRELDVAMSLDQGGSHQTTYVSISSSEDSPAKTSPLPASEPASRDSAPVSSTSSRDVLMTLFSPVDMSSLRTYPDYFPPSVAEISPSFSRRWPTSGFTTSLGACWTAATSEFPNDGGVSSSLHDVLEADVAAKYFLSPKAASGILRRAKNRARTLPRHLEVALESVAAGRPTPSE